MCKSAAQTPKWGEMFYKWRGVVRKDLAMAIVFKGLAQSVK
jgi:hypothetical protein